MDIFEEEQPWGKTLYEIEPGTHVTFNTAIQKVDLITNSHFGRMLFLDGVLQSATADEEIYHRALVGAGMRAESSRVLIAGGAEGAVAREVLKWPVQHIQMIDWDSELVQHLREKEGMNAEIWKSAKLHYSSKDIVAFCEQTTQNFDTVFLDLLDIESKDDIEKTNHILNWVSQVLEPSAVVVMNIGRSKDIASSFQKKLHGEIIEILVPSFQEPWYLLRFRNSTLL
jgi:spermidine synthase